MNTAYNRIAGQSVERLAALSDGVFAIVMTLLILEIHVPAREAIASEQDLLRALAALAPHFVVYGMSFLTLGIFWVGQQTQLSHLARSDRHCTWIHIAFLCAVSVMPFSTNLLAEFHAYRTALVTYWLNILLGGVALYGAWAYAARAGRVKAEAGADVTRGIKLRIVIAQALYAAGALLCLVHPHWSIAAIVLVQLNYAIAPGFRRKS